MRATSHDGMRSPSENAGIMICRCDAVEDQHVRSTERSLKRSTKGQPDRYPAFERTPPSRAWFGEDAPSDGFMWPEHPFGWFHMRLECQLLPKTGIPCFGDYLLDIAVSQ